MCRNRFPWKHGIALLCLLAPFASSIANADNNFVDKSRCRAVHNRCAEGDPACADFRSSLARDGVVCDSDTEVSVQSTPVAVSAPDALSTAQNNCNSIGRASGFGAQVFCLKSQMRGIPGVNADELNLYLLTADKLADDVAQTRSSEAAARVELQKAYLDLKDRTDRRTSERKDSTDQLEVQRATQQAALAMETRQQQQQYAQAVQFCVAEANERMAALGANKQFQMQMQGTWQHAEPNCQSNQYWYKTIPIPPRRLDCQSNGYGSSTCTEQ